MADLDDIAAIKECIDACASPLYFTDDTDIDWLYDNLKDNGICYIAEEEKEIIGYCILIYRDRVWHTAEDIGYAGINQLETTGVREKWQKRGIALELTKLCMRHANTEFVLVTLHPENTASKKILAQCGFAYYKSAMLYGGVPREIWLYNPINYTRERI